MSGFLGIGVCLGDLLAVIHFDQHERAELLSCSDRSSCR